MKNHQAEITVSGRNAQALSAWTKEVGAEFHACDLSDRSSVHDLEQWLAKQDIDILINNAGVAHSEAFGESSDDNWDQMFAVNVYAAMALSRAVLPGMVERGYGRIINIASNAGVMGYAYSAAYCASKHAMVGMTRALAKEFARSKVTINAICPGFVDTAIADTAIANIRAKTGRSLQDAQKAIASMNPQKRLLAPKEVAYFVTMLCAQDSGGMNGQTIVVDGGASA